MYEKLIKLAEDQSMLFIADKDVRWAIIQVGISAKNIPDLLGDDMRRLMKAQVECSDVPDELDKHLTCMRFEYKDAGGV